MVVTGVLRDAAPACTATSAGARERDGGKV